MSLDRPTQERLERLWSVLHHALRLSDELGNYLDASGDVEAVEDAVAYLHEALRALDDVNGT